MENKMKFLFISSQNQSGVNFLSSKKAFEEFRNQVYEGYVAMREGRVITLEELEKRMEQW